VTASRVAVVRDGVDASRWTAASPGPRPDVVPDGTPWIFAAGALVAHKGHRHLVDAMAVLPGVHLVIAGAGPLREALAVQGAARAPGRVHLVGAIPAIDAWIAGCDAFVHPSVEEGMGQVLAEALLAGCAVVASAAGGVPEVVGERGILVPPGDPVALANGIRRTLAERDAWRARAVAAREELARTWGAPRMIAETREACARVLGR
jgi:teichuronic acid biosynthesis glycosyltransferase TuaC